MVMCLRIFQVMWQLLDITNKIDHVNVETTGQDL